MFGKGEAYDAKAIVSNSVRKDARASVRSPKPGGARSTSARWQSRTTLHVGACSAQSVGRGGAKMCKHALAQSRPVNRPGPPGQRRVKW